MQNEHEATHQLAQLLGAEAHEQDGLYSGTGPYALEKPDVVLMPSGLQIRGTREAITSIALFGRRDYLVHLAAAEEFCIESGEQHIDPLGDGRTVTAPITMPSPILLPFYRDRAKYGY
jgi:hypothetical protein